ncbi:MAG: DAK2 domain-containing protein, partial [Chloroflexi bacterium]|nr:DAK2 domain-containing protein [Chloroflexota bacterium]
MGTNHFVIDGHRLKKLLAAGTAWLEQNQVAVNALNVFPVPDGDTGTNMTLTMRHAYAAIANDDDAHIGKVSAAFADGALLGARGNSGVILSQIWAGIAQALADHAHLDATLLVRAAQAAVKSAYAAVAVPVEGTILSIAAAMKRSLDQRHQREPSLFVLLRRMIAAGRAALLRTPEQLPLLKQAGVVDSGGQGLVYIFEGMLRALCGRDLTVTQAPVQERQWESKLEPTEAMGYGYDVQFLMRGAKLDVPTVRAAITDMGDSALVVGSPDVIKVHVHVHDPGVPLSYAINLGAEIDDVVVENMQAQYQQQLQTRWANAPGAPESARVVEGIAVIAVADGAGMHSVFTEQFGAAHVIPGGQTMNPSTGDFLEAIESLPNTEIILLPNNKNILMAAQQVASLITDKQIAVVPSRSVPQGISAMVEYANLRGTGTPCELDQMAAAMTEALGDVTTAQITTAIHDATLDTFTVHAGQIIGVLDGDLVVA